ncbi:MAG: MFS transporter [Rhodothermales bacterium]
MSGQGTSTVRILVVLFLGVLMAALDIAIVGPALPALREHYGLTERAVSWVFNVFVLFNLLGLPFMARLSDVMGRRRVYVADVTLFAVGSLIVAAAPAFPMLLAGRALQGLGASGIFPVASAVVGDVVAPSRRGRALGILGAVFGIAFIVGPILAGVLLLLGWQWLFIINVPLALVIIGLGWRALPDTVDEEGGRMDLPGIATLGLMLVSFAFGINRIDTGAFLSSLTSAAVAPYLVMSLVLLPVFIRLERRSKKPLVRLELFRNRQVAIVAALGMGAGLTEAAFVFMPGMAVQAFEVTKSSASFMLLPLVTAVAIGSPIAGRSIDRFGSRTITVVSTALLTVGLATMGLPILTTTTFYAASVLIGLGLSGILGSSLSYILLHESKAAERTVAQGIGTLSISVGQLSGGALIGAVVSSAAAGLSGYQSAFAGIAFVGVVLVGLSAMLKSRRRELEDAGHEE